MVWRYSFQMFLIYFIGFQAFADDYQKTFAKIVILIIINMTTVQLQYNRQSLEQKQGISGEEPFLFTILSILDIYFDLIKETRSFTSFDLCDPGCFLTCFLSAESSPASRGDSG